MQQFHLVRSRATAQTAFSKTNFWILVRLTSEVVPQIYSPGLPLFLGMTFEDVFRMKFLSSKNVSHLFPDGDYDLCTNCLAK